MNNDQNNNLNGIITPEPIIPNDSTNNIQNTVNNNGQTISPTPIIPIQPISDNNSNSENNLNPSINNANNGQVTPSIIIPEMKNNSTLVNNNASNVSSQTPELKLNDTNPFDIGINQASVTPTLEQQNVIQPTVNNGSTVDLSNNQNVSEQVIKPINSGETLDINSPEVTSNNDNVVSVGNYLINMILFSIPLVGFIVLILKIVDKKDKNISNLAKAYLLLGVILVVIWIVFFAIFGATLFTLGNS